MRREYNLKNKINFVIIGVLSILIIIIFSLFIIKFVNTKKVEYLLSKGSIVFDVDKNKINIDNGVTMRLKWNGNYYISSEEGDTILGRRVILYNDLTKSLDLYGKFYEIVSSGEVNINNDVININTQSDSKFYKLEDRKYLLVDRSIKSTDGALDTSNYLIVELDKQGNALLLNNNIHYKTLSETIINTSSYSLDVANEILSFGEDKIDLKKIIGSSNLYKPDSDKEDTGTGENTGGNGGSGGGSGTGGGNGSGTGTGTGTGGSGTATGDNGVINKGEDGEDVTIKYKKTSVLSVVPSIDSINVDYFVYDPNDEYKSFYVIVSDGVNSNTIYLSKSNTNIILNGLKMGTKYNLKFMFSYLDNDGNMHSDSFSDIDVNTVYPSYDISLVKVSKVSNELSYRVNLDNRYTIDKVNVSLIIDDDIIDSKSVSVSANAKSVVGSFVLPNINKGSVVIVRLDSVSSNGNIISSGNYYKYINE